MRPNTLLAFIGGALAGAAVALLYAPDKGEHIRKKIREKAEEEYYTAKNRIKQQARMTAERHHGPGHAAERAAGYTDAAAQAQE